jgi:hypothetical protein
MTQATTAVQRAKITPQLPAEMRDEIASEALAIKDQIGTPSGDNIAVTRDKTFRLPGSDAEAPEITAVIVDWVTYNQYYKGKFDPKNIQPPVCAALGKVIKEMIPIASAPQVQHSNCEECPKNQWGSDPQGGRGKACKNQRLLALLPPDNIAGGPLMLLKVSPMGLTNFDKYVAKFASSNSAVPHAISAVTRISFDQKAEYPLLVFAADGLNEDVEAAAARRKEARARLLTEPDMGPKLPANGGK